MEKEYDLLSLINILLRHIIAIIIVTLLASCISYFVASQIITKQYSSSAKLYVENKAVSGETTTVNDITVAQKLVNTCSIIFKSDSIMNELAKDKAINYSVDQLKSMITVSSINSTEVMEIKVVCNDPLIANYIASYMVDLCMEKYREIIASGSITVVDEASYSEIPTSPNVLLTTLFGTFIGFVFICGCILAKELLDKRVKPGDDLTEMYNIPVFADIMDFESKTTKTKYAYKQ